MVGLVVFVVIVFLVVCFLGLRIMVFILGGVGKVSGVIKVVVFENVYGVVIYK